MNDRNDPPDLWMSPRAAAAKVGLAPETIRMYCRTGKLAHRKLATGRIRIHITEIEKLFVPVPTHPETTGDALIANAVAIADRIGPIRRRRGHA